MKHQFRSFFAKLVWHNWKLRAQVLGQLEREDVKGFKQFDDHQLVFHINDLIGQTLREQGNFDRASVRALRDKLGQQGINTKGITILEVGANIGTQTVYFCKDFEDCNVIAVEPDADNMALLEANVALNALTDRVSTYLIGASDADGSAEFVINNLNRGESSLIENVGPLMVDKSGNLRDTCTSVSVPVRRLDRFLTDHGIGSTDIGLIWMDVEGHEMKALQGLSSTLNKNPIPLYFEFSPDRQSREDVDSLIALLDSLYETAYLRRDGFHEMAISDIADLTALHDILVI